jgi:signal transduction histidine kinase
MKLFGEEWGRVGRWYLVLPPLALIALLAALFLFAIAGQSRLEAANERVHDSQGREQSLSEYLALITGAETAQRGYILTGERIYLEPYTADAGRVRTALERVRRAYAAANDPETDRTAELEQLTADKLSELQETLLAYQNRAERPFDFTRIDQGKVTMDRILSLVAEMRTTESMKLAIATQRWRDDLLWSRWFTVLGGSLNFILIIASMRLVFIEIRRRARQAEDLRDQKQELERQVAARTRELTALSTHLQEVSEQEKSALSRELHDELGGLLVAARMDLSWLQQRLPTSDPAIEQRFKRIHDSLSAGVDLKRRVVEELRPTLLDNMGLFTALRWQFKETCRRTGLQCSESFPDEEPTFDPVAAIGIFRVAQEAMTNILKHAMAKKARLSIRIVGESFVLEVGDDGRGVPAGRLGALVSHGLGSMRHRVTALGGTWELSSPPEGGTTVTAVIPLDRILLSGSA